MDDSCCGSVMHETNLASWKAEEAAWRRIQAASWLDNMVGPLNLPKEPSEHEFLSCLRNGLVLCNTINRVVPGSVTKVVENPVSRIHLDAQPLPAYQYFENARNFLIAMEELKLPTFEASDLERDIKDVGASAKVVDSILALKCYYEWKLLGKVRDGQLKYAKSAVRHPFSAKNSQVQAATSPILKPSGQLNVLPASYKKLPYGTDQKQETSDVAFPELVDSLVKAIADSMLGSKENIDADCQNYLKTRNMSDIAKIISAHLENYQIGIGGLKRAMSNVLDSIIRPALNANYCSLSPIKAKSNHSHLLEAQVKELIELKGLFFSTKEEFTALQNQMQIDINHLGRQIRCMSAAAQGYKQVVEDNRKLYNTLHDLKGNIRVSCRIRPAFVARAQSTVSFIGDDGSLIITDLLASDNISSKVFQFDKIFNPTSSQGELFSYTKPLIRSVMDGYNVCILAYGQTGSGKTYTMSGPSTEPFKGEGINHLAFKDLFDISSQRKDHMKYDIKVQMVEIYHEQVRDLLVEDGSVKSKLEIPTSTSIGNLCLPGANVYPVHSTEDALNLMKLGEKNRVVNSAAVNDSSRRSHSILVVHVKGRDEDGNAVNSCLHLVDLAGSERVTRSAVVGERPKEAQYIDQSLSCLGDVISALAEKDSPIPYRNSKLTRLLQNFLEEQAKILMIAHVSPEAEFYRETLDTLKFAQRASAVELGAARLNKESNCIQKLREQVEDLKQELSRRKERKAFKQYSGSPIDTFKNNQIFPPRRRRFSIEEQSYGKAQTLVKEAPKPVVTPVRRSRRLSLEGSKYQMKTPTAARNNFAPGSVNASLIGINIANDEVETSNSNCTPKAVYSQNVISPKRTAGTDIPNVKMYSRVRTSTKSPKTITSAVVFQGQPQSSVAREEGSRIRKSFLNIGKFIYGPDKSERSELKTSPIGGIKNDYYDGKSSSKNSGTTRRQSLTGTHLSALQTSRRASLGGKLDPTPKTTRPTAMSSNKTSRRLL